MKIYETMHHRGGFEEALKTRRSIDPYLAEYLIDIGTYKEYSYDERIHATRYIIKVPISENWAIPMWLLEYKAEEPKTINELRKIHASLKKTEENKEMRKDGKSQYQLKKDKLLKIKNIIKNEMNMEFINESYYYEEELTPTSTIKKIWNIVKDEKDND